MTAHTPPSSPPPQPARSRRPRQLLPLSIAALLLALPGCALEWRAAMTSPAEDERCDDDERADGPMAAAILDAIDPQQTPENAAPPSAEPDQAPPAAAEPPEAQTSGETIPRVTRTKAPFNKDLIRRVVRAHINEVRDCYNDGLGRDPALAGKVVATFKITPEGGVSTSQVGELELADEEVATCIVDAIKTWEFPGWSASGDTVVNYPFKLEPG